MKPLIDAILSRHGRDGHRFDGVTAMLDLAESDPAALEALLLASMARDCAPATFLDRALGVLADDCLPGVADAAWQMFTGGSANRQSRQILGYALYQACGVLTDNWEWLLEATEQADGAAGFPWQALPADVADCWADALNAASGREQVARARALLRSRNATVRVQALAYLQRATGQTAETWSHEAGIDAVTGSPLHGDHPLHLQFGPAQRKVQLADAAPWRRRLWRLHATWGSGVPSGHAQMGGHLQARCGFCHAPLQRLLTLDAHRIGATARATLTLGLCLDCCGWNGAGPLYYRHDPAGLPSAHPSQWHDVPVEDVEDTGTLMAAELGLVQLGGDRWREQDWGLSNHDENLSRVGGAPSWVQGAHYPACPDCGATMPFVMQLDSTLPADDGRIVLWGSGGMLYTFWCDGCAVSGQHWQCT